MANPRATVDFTEVLSANLTFKRKTTSTGAIDYLYSTTNPYPAGTTTQAGQSASMDSDSTVRVGASDDVLIGRILSAEADNTATVQVCGAMSFPYSAGASAPVLGRGVVCDGAGGVKIATAGVEYKERGRVLQKDATALTVTVLLF